MQFCIPAPAGPKLYKPNAHTRDELKYAFKELRKMGHGKNNLILGSIYEELWPTLARKGHAKWLKERGFV